MAIDEARFQELFAQARDESSDALGELLMLYVPELERSLLRRYSGNSMPTVSIQNILGEALLLAVRDYRKYRGGADSRTFRAWLTTIVKHQLYQERRRLNTEKRRGELARKSLDFDPIDRRMPVTEMPSKKELLQIFSKLRDPLNRLAILRWVEGKSLKDIAAEFVCSTSKISKDLDKIRRKITDEFGGSV